MHHTAEWPRPADWGAAWQWLVGTLPASFAGRPLTFRSRGRDRQTLCSGMDRDKSKNKEVPAFLKVFLVLTVRIFLGR